MRLSLIIPVYNVEKYLRKCLDSCFYQDIPLNDYEVICVNDGSSDNCISILEEYSTNFINLKIISQQNQGLSIARNNGLSEAIGDYIWFIDSDDSIENNVLASILKELDSNPDILQLNYQYIYEDGRNPVKYYCSQIQRTQIDGKTVISYDGLPAPAQFNIYRRSFLNDYNLRFYPNIYHEDSEFKPRAVYFAKSIKFHKPIVYNYLQRSSGSITSNFKYKNGADIITVLCSLHNFYIDNVIEKDCRKGFYSLIGLSMNTLLYGIKNLNIVEKNKIISRLCSKRFLFIDMMKSKKIKYKVEGIILYINPKIALYLHNILK